MLNEEVTVSIMKYSDSIVSILYPNSRWEAVSVQPVWYALHSEISPPETWEDPHWWVRNTLVCTFIWLNLNPKWVFFPLPFLCFLFRGEAFSLRWVWDEVHPEIPHGETQEDSQWREALPMWLLSPSRLRFYLLVHYCTWKQHDNWIYVRISINVNGYS